ncbi:MAG: two-component system LytT family sensor kinase [Cognaticolwellia sp.]|jgi:two-component system LytT family sensor kinase
MDSNILHRLFLPKQRFIWHIVFWVSILVMFTSIDVSEYSENWQKVLLSNFLGLPVMIMATYLTLYVLLPIFLIKRAYNQFFILFILSAFGFGLLQRAIAQYIIFPQIWEKYLEHGWFVFYKIAFNIINIYIVVLAAVAIKLLKIALQNEYTRQLLEQEKLRAELKFLKSQIHPHFLFNTLNNLYALTLQNSTKAPEVVLKLSSLLDYMLFESNVPEVPLSKEISLINNYISLEKMRYGDALEVSFNFSIDSIEREISPLLFFPFVEYAFQQSLMDNSEPIWITIDLEIKNNILLLEIENAKFNSDSIHNYDSLANVQRRLKLLYPKKHELKLLDTEETHSIVLSLEI